MMVKNMTIIESEHDQLVRLQERVKIFREWLESIPRTISVTEKDCIGFSKGWQKPFKLTVPTDGNLTAKQALEKFDFIFALNANQEKSIH